MHMPNLIYFPLSYIEEDPDADPPPPAETLPSGVKRFPFLSPYGHKPVPFKECAHFVYPFFDNDEVSLEGTAKLFDQSFYPTPEMVLKYAESRESDTPTYYEVGEHFKTGVLSVMHLLGPGIYYHSSCRDVDVDENISEREKRRIDLTIAKIKDVEKKRKV